MSSFDIADWDCNNVGHKNAETLSRTKSVQKSKYLAKDGRKKRKRIKNKPRKDLSTHENKEERKKSIKSMKGNKSDLTVENRKGKKRDNIKSRKMIMKTENAVVQDRKMKLLNKKSKLLNLLNKSTAVISKKRSDLSLRDRMIQRLKASRFRYINEQIYNSDRKHVKTLFESDPDAFQAYHDGYRQQVSKWPLNPLDVIIDNIRRMPKSCIIADMGCGEATLAKSISQTVHSFDLVAVNKNVTACDMRRVPLGNDTIDVVVFCLSLMGTDIKEYLHEANRILKNGGMLKIAEVESRFEGVNVFMEGMKHFGFMLTWKDLSNNLFYFLDFKKESRCKSLNKLPSIGLYPCLYKKR